MKSRIVDSPLRPLLSTLYPLLSVTGSSLYSLLSTLCIVLLCSSCQNDLPAKEVDDSDLVPVHFRLRGYYGAPFSDLGDNSSRADEDYPRDLEAFKPGPLPPNSTVWVAIEHTGAEGAGHEPDVRAFLVDVNGMLYPCEVDDDGNCIRTTNRPIYLSRNHAYSFKLVGPARKLTDDFRLYIENGQEVYAHDNRYPQTKPKENYVITDKDEVDVIELNPLIQQTAKLKFTIMTKSHEEVDDKGNPFTYSPIHSLEINETGVVITGLQEHYSQTRHEGDKTVNNHDPSFVGDDDFPAEPWNWKLADTYLMPFPGKVRNYITLTAANATEMTNEKLVLETCILPCDATATPIIVGFYLNVNGVPTQFEMMLNRKMFLHGYQYHYLGTLDIENGISVIEWQTIIQDLGSVNVPYTDKEEPPTFKVNNSVVDVNGDITVSFTSEQWQQNATKTFTVTRTSSSGQESTIGLDQFTINGPKVSYVKDESKNKLKLEATTGYYIVNFHISDLNKTITAFQVNENGDLLYIWRKDIWTGEKEFDGTWEMSEIIGAPSEGNLSNLWDGVIVGDRIRTTGTFSENSYAKYAISSDGWPDLGEGNPGEGGYFDYIIPDQATLDQIKQNGLVLYGVNYTATKVEVQKNSEN